MCACWSPAPYVRAMLSAPSGRQAPLLRPAPRRSLWACLAVSDHRSVAPPGGRRRRGGPGWSPALQAVDLGERIEPLKTGGRPVGSGDGDGVVEIQDR